MTRVQSITYETYKNHVYKNIKPFIGGIELIKLTPMQVQGFYNTLKNEGRLSDRTIQDIHKVVHSSLEKALRWGMVNKNVASLVDTPRVTKKEINVWDIDDIQLFLETAKSDRYYIAFVLALTTGMRRAEVLGLRWKDIDFENNSLSVIQTLSPDGKGFKPTKTNSGKRNIALPEDTVIMLLKHKKHYVKEKEMYEPDQNHDLVICTISGTPLIARNLLRSFDRLVKKAGVPKITFHDTRHTHASLLAKQNENPKVVQERLGHANVRITLDTYSHIFPNMQKDAAKKFGENLFGKKEALVK